MVRYDDNVQLFSIHITSASLQTEITNHELRIKAVCQEGEKMIGSGHYGKDAIQSKTQELELHWKELKV